MAEETESVRQDTASRRVTPKQIQDWGGRRVILPKGTTLPAEGVSGEVFVLIKDAGIDQMYIFDESESHWSTVGPRT